jgi:AraC-like DNA-binding protein
MPPRPKPARPRPDTDRSAFARLNSLPTQLNLPGITCRIVYWGLNPANANDTSSHSHSFYEACYVFTGAGSVRIQNRTHPLARGSIFLLRPDQTHRIRSSTSNPMGIYFWAFTLESPLPLVSAPVSRQTTGSPRNQHLPSTPLFQDTSQDPAHADLAHLTQSFIKSTRSTAKPPPITFEPILKLLQSEAQSRPPAPGFAFAVSALTRKLILETLRAFTTTPALSKKPRPQPTHQPTPIARALLFVHDNFTRPITVAQIAQHVHLGERQLARLFQQSQSTSVAKYLTSLRIEAAGRMLLAGGLSIKQIAARSGYSNVAYFTAVFKKSTRLTPGQYRNLKGHVYPLRKK